MTTLATDATAVARRAPQGYGIPLAAWAVSIALTLAVVAAAGTDQEATWLNLKLTGRWSFLVFLLAYVARPTHQLWRTQWTQWLLARRRLFGIGFALAHFTHLALILYLFSLAAPGQMPMTSDGRQMALFVPIGGGFAFLLVAAMLATSFDAGKDWMRSLHPKSWKILHRFGVHYFMFIFTFDWIKGAALKSPLWFYLPFLVASMAAIGLRVYVHRVAKADR